MDKQPFPEDVELRYGAGGYSLVTLPKQIPIPTPPELIDDINRLRERSVTLTGTEEECLDRLSPMITPRLRDRFKAIINNHRSEL